MSFKPKKQLKITKREPHRCTVCNSAEVTHYISYYDPLSPSYAEWKGKHYPCPVASGRSCDAHVYEVTAIVLRQAGVKEPENEQAISPEGLPDTP